MYKAKDEKQVVVFGLKAAFGGGRSTGFALVYDSIEALKAFEPKHRLLRVCNIQTKDHPPLLGQQIHERYIRNCP